MTPAWLSQLAPAHPPPPPGWWPPAPGWWALAVLLLAAVAGGLWWWRDPYRRSRRAALRELRAIRAAEPDAAASARAIESLLRRFAIAVFGGARVARLTGDAWLEFVAAAGGAQLAGEAGRSLLTAAFGGVAKESDRDCWIAGADAFVRHARASGVPSSRTLDVSSIPASARARTRGPGGPPPGTASGTARSEKG